jgi:two-component system, chemotaxis family, chemotaxis protein CheY
MISDATAAPTVLVVDDAPTVRLYHSMLLRDAGFHIHEAANGLEAVEAALLMPFDLFVIDVNMPVMDGYTCVETLRSAAVGTGAPVVMVSTEDRPEDADRAYQAGANLYLVKPVAAERLARVVAMLVHAKGVAR